MYLPLGQLRVLLCAIVLQSVVLRPAASCAELCTIHNSQFSIQVQAGVEAPRLVSFRADGTTPWRNFAPEPLVPEAELDGQSFSLHWHRNRAENQVSGSVIAFVYESSFPQLRLTWKWRTPLGYGPIEHSIHVENLSGREIWIPLQDSFRIETPVASRSDPELSYVEKGAGEPSDVGTHREAIAQGSRWVGTSSTYAHPAPGEAREIIPWLAIGNTIAPATGFYIGIEFSGRTRISVERDGTALRAVAGLNPTPGPYKTRLSPQQSFDTPTVFLGTFSGDLDSMGNTLRRWVRQALTNPRAWQDPHYPLLVNNSWGSGMQVDEALARRMIHDSADLGLEMFHLDAGWFRAVGDWYPDPRKFPHGLAALADEAHHRGLRFGIWTDWTQAGLGAEPSALNLRDPIVHNWAVSDLPATWTPDPFKGQTVDLGVPAAQSYAQKEVLRMVGDYRLDMLEHDGYLVAQGCVRADHPHAPPDPAHMVITKDQGSYFVSSSNSTDVSYHATRAYYEIHDRLRRKFPNLILEVCNDGGRMVDFGSAAHGDYFSITDTYTPLANRRAFYDASYLLPPAMLETYVENWTPARTSLDSFRYMLRSGMMGWLTLMLDTTSWTGPERAAARQEIQLYKDRLRPLIREADLYHCGARPDGSHWDAMEYFDSRRGQGVVYVFRGALPGLDRQTLRLHGLQSTARYRLRFQDGTSADRIVSGRDLVQNGVDVSIPGVNRSELIWIEQVIRAGVTSR